MQLIHVAVGVMGRRFVGVGDVAAVSGRYVSRGLHCRRGLWESVVLIWVHSSSVNTIHMGVWVTLVRPRALRVEGSCHGCGHHFGHSIQHFLAECTGVYRLTCKHDAMLVSIYWTDIAGIIVLTRNALRP